MEEKKKGKGILAAILFGCVVFVVVAAAGYGIYRFTAGDGTGVRYPDYSESYYVNDYCGALSQEAEREIAVASERLASLTGAQVVVAAVPDTQQLAIEEYSLNLANAWGIGNSNKNNGILILLVTGSKSIRLEVGKGLEELLPEEKAGQILDQCALKPLEAEKYNEASTAACMEVIKTLYAYNGLDAPGSLQVVKDRETTETSESSDISVSSSPEEAQSPADMDINEASQGRKPKAHGSGRFAGCGATRP